MIMYLVSIALLFLCTLSTSTAVSSNPNHVASDISISCGSSGTSAATNGREWLGDVQPKVSSFVKVKGSSTTSTVIHNKLITADSVPYKTARISSSQFSYTFQMNPGQKIIRLHFNPTPYKGFKGLKDLFTVEAGPFSLLSNFSASLTAQALGVNFFVKEFCLYLQEDEQLNITLSPESSILPVDTYAFINGIEIVSVPTGLSYFRVEDVGVQVVGQKSQVYVDYNTALEKVHRQDIKNDSVQSTVRDSGHTFPMWETREGNKIDSTWKISVDKGFRYLIRLHFSEIGLKIAESGDVMFRVFINEMIVNTSVDMVKQRQESSIIPWYVDYMVMMRGQKRGIKRDLLISVQSYDDHIGGHGLIAGFEMLKLSNPDNSLASPNPLPPAQDSPPRIQTFLLLGQRNAIATVAIIILSLVSIIVHTLREFWEARISKEVNKPSARAQRLCRRFSLDEIQSATRNFNDALLIGRGGFGKVYKGLIDKGQTVVAVKRLKSNSTQGAREFLTEIETLSELRHLNLVPLIGYCNVHGEMILVYDYMEGGTLADHLYKLPREGNNSSSLSWKQRLNICIGAARGLDYLHTGHGVIHRDVKSSNILLDENFTAKVSDFGLAKHENRSKFGSHVSTRVKGTRGYFDPHYINTCKLTRKSDTYAFGVVLLEILCGRPAVDFKVPEEDQILTKWARENIGEGKVDQIVASSLRDEISENSLKAFVDVAEKCLHDEPKKRPTMAQVVLLLESVLEQQNGKQVLGLDKIASVFDDTSGQLALTSTDLQNLTPPPREQTHTDIVNAEVSSEIKSGEKAAMPKPPRLWPWDAFWNRVKPFKKNDLLIAEISEANVKLRRFHWGTIAAATARFSYNRRVGKGGHSIVYKGLLPTGEIVAVKRHSQDSSLEIYKNLYLKIFKNEIHSQANLQHQNIIKLLGYCIHKDEKLVVYEFMANNSLRNFIGGEKSYGLLWPTRFKITRGIAQGLVYLHQESGLRRIHRNIHPVNILLDEGMNPKIAGFSNCRTLPEDESECDTGAPRTFGYIPPENYVQRKYSVKTDVFCFGIVVLEIISGRRWTPGHEKEGSVLTTNLALKLWNKGRALNLVDKSLGGAFPVEEALRCIEVSLVCTHKEPHQRPDMPTVLKMLEGEKLDQWPQVPKEHSASTSVRPLPSLHIDEPVWV